MRILLATQAPPDPTAAGAIPPLLAAALEGLRAEHDVTLACIASPDEPGELEAVERLRAAGVDVDVAIRERPTGLALQRRRLRMARAWLLGRWPWRTVWFWEPGFQGVLDRLLTERDFDVIAVENNAMAIYDYGASTPAVLTEHEVRPPLQQPRRRLLRPLAARDLRLWEPFERRYWPRFDLLQVYTERDASDARERAPQLSGRVRVVPFGVPLPAAVPPHSGDARTLLFAGNYTHPPNVDAALWIGEQIMPRLLELCPDARLELAGLHAPAELLALAERPGIELLGAVPDLEPVIARAAIVLAPVRTGGGMRMKVIHALALGKPVITTSLGVEGVSALGDPPLVIADSAEEVAREAARLLGDAAAREALGSAARAFAVEHLSPPAYAGRLAAAYSEAIELHRAAQ